MRRWYFWSLGGEDHRPIGGEGREEVRLEALSGGTWRPEGGLTSQRRRLQAWWEPRTPKRETGVVEVRPEAEVGEG